MRLWNVVITGWTYGRAIVVPGSIGYSLDLAHHTAPIVVKGFSMLVIVL